MRTQILIFSIVLSLFFSPLMVSHSEAKPFYEGKVIKLIVSTRPGGGYDFYGRLIAKYMQKYLPGSTFIVKNIPGAGDIIGTNELYNAKPNGLTLGIFNRAVGLSQVIGVKGVKFDFRKFTFLGAASSEIYSFAVSAKKYRNIDDVLKDKNVRIASSGLGTMNYITPMLFYFMMGQDNYTLATGYQGGEPNLAVMRGEMDGTFGSFNSRKPIVDNGSAIFAMFIAKTKPAGYEDVPFIQDVIKNKKYKSVADFLVGMQVIGRPFALPPGMPRDRFKIMRKAFEKAVNDPECVAFGKKAERPVFLIPAEEAQKWAQGIFDLPPEVVKVLKKASTGGD